ncbi:MAG TPA: hypothetical protein VG269_16575 [Tepidisphaeraceae bacterium]|jgi:hypothetical protein|nr:hypothetical protein [Tepidisphaeraceae bacterium]
MSEESDKLQTLKIPDEAKRLLHGTTIGPTSPGSIVRDFQTLIDFIGSTGVEAAGQHHYLPIKILPTLNLQMTTPLKVELQRPQLRSYPNLQGLHLLARTTGLVVVQGTGSKARLVVNPEALASWETLNVTERYFSLLDAWLVYSKAETVGGHGGWMDEEPMYRILEVWRRIGARGKRYTLKQRSDANNSLDVDYERYRLLLMQLFGFVEIEQGKPIKGRSWFPEAVRYSPFGKAVFEVLGRIFAARDIYQQMIDAAGASGPPSIGLPVIDGDGNGELEEDDDEEDEDDEDDLEAADDGDGQAALSFSRDVCFDDLRIVFDPYFPEWVNSLCLKGTGFRDGVFVFKVSLGKIWRRIAVPAHCTLELVSDAILRSVKFDDDHLWTFKFPDRVGGTAEVMHPYAAVDHNLPAGDEVEMGELPLAVGEHMVFHFDFGDDWKFDMELEKIDPPKPKLKKPKLLESHGKAPEQYEYWDE